MNTTVQTSGTTGRAKRFTLTEAQIAGRAADLPRIRPPGWAALSSLYQDRHPSSAGTVRDRHWMTSKGGKFFGPLATWELTIRQFIDNNIQGIHASPVALVRFAAALAGSGYRPSIILAGGSPLTAAQSRAIRAGLGDNLWVSYSTSETGTIALGTAAQAESVAGCVGKPCAGVQVQIVENQIQAKTPIMITGYNDPVLTAKCFAAGWFLTGDTGRLQADGTLVLTGRG